MKIKAIIVDDEKQSRDLIYNFCTTYHNDEITIIEQCDSVNSAIIAINNFNPDLVFLDIEMPEKNGFDLINHFETVPFKVVFITAHPDFYLEAIKCSALDYIMKPINPLTLKSIIDKVKKTELIDENFKNSMF